MLHTATLVHDDLVDEAQFRRGVSTLNSKWGPGVAVIVGDHLFAQAANLVALTENPSIVKTFSKALVTICRGELGQAFESREWAHSRKGYYERIFGKTASLFSAASETAGMLSKAPAPMIESLREFGYQIGMAFQIIDDVLDFVGDEAKLGKPVGSDLRQGLVTLPTLWFLERHPNHALVLDILQNGHQDDGPVKEAVNIICQSGAIEAALDEASQFVRRSQVALKAVPPSEYRDALGQLGDFVVDRNR